MKKRNLKLTLLLLFTCSVLFCQPNYIDTYIEWTDPLDLLYSTDRQLTSITANHPDPGGLDYITAHTTRIDQHGGSFGDIIDEGFTLSKIYVNSKNEAIQQIENIFVDISTPDEIGATLVDNNYEMIYDLKVDNDGYLIGTGIYHELTECKGSGGIGGGIGGDPATRISVPYPFYFKYDLDLDVFIFFRRMRSPNGNCGLNPLDGIPIDIEVLNNSEYAICMSEGADRGLLRVSSVNGALLGAKRYNYPGGKIFDPVDIEVTSNRIFAVGKVHFGFPAVYKPALLSTQHNLNSVRLRYYNVPASTSSSDKLKMSGVRYNPVSNSLLLAGWALDGVGAIVAIHVDNLTNLQHEWLHMIDLDVPGAISNFSLTFGLEYLQGRDKFALHGYGIENYGTDGTGSGLFNYLLEIGSDANDPVDIKRLDYSFHTDDKNEYPANNTLVQSPRSDYLGLVLHRHFESDPFTPISMLKTDLDLASGSAYECLTSVPSGVETPNTHSYLIKHSTASIPSFTEDKELVQIVHLVPDTEIECQGLKIHTLKQPMADTRGDNPIETDFFIYPNPASGNISFNKAGDYTIFDVNGQKLIRKYGVTTMDISNLNSGLYFVFNETGQVEKLFVR